MSNDNLVPNDKLVIQWPLNERLPLCGEQLDPREFTFSVSATQIGWSKDPVPKRLVEIEVHRRIV